MSYRISEEYTLCNSFDPLLVLVCPWFQLPLKLLNSSSMITPHPGLQGRSNSNIYYLREDWLNQDTWTDQESNPLLRPFCPNIKGCQVDGTLKAPFYNVSIGSKLQIAWVSQCRVNGDGSCQRSMFKVSADFLCFPALPHCPISQKNEEKKTFSDIFMWL